MSAVSTARDLAAAGGRIAPPGTFARRPLAVLERNARAYRRMWWAFLSGFVEPFLYLASIGIGVGALVGDVDVGGGRTVPYEVFVAPGLFAVAAMNGAIMDTTFNFFIKFKYGKVYDAILATPLDTRDVATGEVTWAVLRGSIYAAAFLAAMVAFGLVQSWWGLLALPIASLIAFAFAGAGLGAATYIRSFVDFDYISLVLVPSFLFSATFFPLDQYPGWVAAIVQLTPLYQGVALARGAVLGDMSWTMILHVAYLAAMGLAGCRVAAHRLGTLLQP
jgi:lipooligosaccharide transport system permease protein